MEQGLEASFPEIFSEKVINFDPFVFS